MSKTQQIQKVENWNGNEIRFIGTNGKEWQAVAKDVADALDYNNTNDMTKYLNNRYLGSEKVDMTGRTTSSHTSQAKGISSNIRRVTTLTEEGIYKAIFHSHKKEAEDFQDWVLDVLTELRKATQLEGFEIFKMLDKEQQKKAMSNLKQNTPEVRQYDYINANRTANRVVSDMYGHTKGKALSKSEMSPEMLVARQSILDDSANLYSAKRNFHLDISVRDALNNKYSQEA